MKMKLGIYGSAAGDLETAFPAAEKLGQVLRNYVDDIILITGACTGLPYRVIEVASPSGIEIWGYSAEISFEELKKAASNDDHSLYTKLIYVPKEFPYVELDRPRKKYRNVISTAECDMGIIISGRWGTLNEFTNLIDFQKTVGVLTGTGGIADELPELVSKIKKSGQGSVIFESDPEILLQKLIEASKNKIS